MKIYSLDATDWPLLINNPGEGDTGIAARFELPPKSSGVDAAGRRVYRAALAALRALNAGRRK